MKRSTLVLAGILAVLLCLQASTGNPRGTDESRSPAFAPPRGPRADADFGKIPLQFIPNEGQVEGPAAFYVQGRQTTIYFAAEGLTFVLSGRQGSPPGRWVVKLDFVGADPEAIPVSAEGSGAVVSYFKGSARDWKAGLKASSRIVYRELWPGIDLAYYGTADRMKYEFIVKPGADPSRIKLAYRGAESVTLTDEGRLAVSTPSGGFEDDVPVAWQEIEATRVNVPVAYSLDMSEDGREAGGRTCVYAFDVGEYDDRRPLVLDPAVLVYCGYIGGSGADRGAGIAVDADGNAYVGGDTLFSPGFPVTVGPDLTVNSELLPDAFIAKVGADGTSLVYCGYIGGSGVDEGGKVAVDASGNAYLTGYSSSSDFPVTPGSSLTYKAYEDAFVAKVNADGTALVYSGLIGGWGEEAGFGIAVGGSGCAYVVGETFVAKVNAAGTGLSYFFQIGGGVYRSARAIALDSSENAYITGAAGWDLPVKVGPDLTWNGDATDAFVAKVNAAGTDLVYCGFIGGSGNEVGHAISVDGAGCAYVTGSTSSDELSFPVKIGPDLTWNGGSADAFVAKVNAAGTALAYCGYIGGAVGDSYYGADNGYGIAVDSSGNAYITGQTECSEASFPVKAGPDPTFNGYDDAFVAKVNAAGTALIYCGYIGGEFSDWGTGIAVDGSGNAYITGLTSSSEATFPVTGGPDLTINFNEGDDGFVAKVSSDDVPGPVLTSLAPSSGATGGPAFTLTVAGADFDEGAVVMWDGDDRPTTFVSAQELRAELGAPDLEVGKVVAVTVLDPDGGISNAAEFTINNPAPALISLSPAQALLRNSGPHVTVSGSNFVTNSVVRLAGNDRPTTFVSGTELTAVVAPEDMTTAGRFPITVYNPPPAGGTSGSLEFSVVTYTTDVSPAGLTVTAGQAANYTVMVNPQYGPLDSAVVFSCKNIPPKCVAFFTPDSVTPGANQASSTLMISTKAPTQAALGGMASATPPVLPAFGLLIFIPAIALLSRQKRSSPAAMPSRRRLAVAALIGLLGWLACCSAGGDGDVHVEGTPPGNYRITIEAKAGNLTMTEYVDLIVQY